MSIPNIIYKHGTTAAVLHVLIFLLLNLQLEIQAIFGNVGQIIYYSSITTSHKKQVHTSTYLPVPVVCFPYHNLISNDVGLGKNMTYSRKYLYYQYIFLKVNLLRIGSCVSISNEMVFTCAAKSSQQFSLEHYHQFGADISISSNLIRKARRWPCLSGGRQVSTCHFFYITRSNIKLIIL